MNDKIKEAFQQWKDDYALVYEPNYSEATEADCLAAYEAGYLAHQKEAAEQKPVAEVNSLNGCTSTTWKEKLADGKHNLYAAPINQSPVGYVAHGSTLQPSERVFAGCSILDAEEASDYLPECITELYAAPVDQSARIAELESEVKYVSDFVIEWKDLAKKQKRQLTAAQAENQKLLSQLSGFSELLEQATSYTSCQSWSPSLTDEIEAAIANVKGEV